MAAPEESTRRSAFTLVELLVVIGIIAVLIAVLLPALSAARRQASTTKCATALRELGNALNMYATEYKGYLPPVQLRTVAGRSYSLYDTNYPVQGSGGELVYAYWHNFLSKYVTKGKVGGEATDMVSISETKNRTIIWGCPEWEGIRTGTTFGGINRVMTGYGMNLWPTFSVDRPQIPGPHFPAGPGYLPNSRERNLIENWGSSVQLGAFQKQITYGKKGAERMLLSDSHSWASESGRLPPNTPIPNQFVGVSYVQYTQMTAGRTTVDLYRHGKPSRVFPGSPASVSTSGGKMGFNILWADGHVSLGSDLQTAWKSLRMRYPE